MTVAILIPTRNRPDFIERTMAYYDSVKSEHPVYIGDASRPEIAARTAAFAKKLSHAKVRYFHWEGLPATETTIKLAELAQAECAYCALHGDDDYLVPSSLSQCSEFLSRQPDYRTVQGRGVLFTLDRPGPFGEVRSLGDYWGVNALEQSSAVERLAAFEAKYFITAFSTHRTAEFVRDSQQYAAVKDNGFAELLHCYTFAIRGKSKFLDCLYLIRHAHEDRHIPGALEWIVQEHWCADYHKTLDVLAIALREASDLPLTDARQVVSDVLQRYLKRYMASEVGCHNTTFRAMVLMSLPRPVRSAMRLLRRRVMDPSDMRLLPFPRSRFHADFVPVLQSVTNTCHSRPA